MTRKDRQRFDREFKLEAVRLANESGKMVTEVARELGISVQLLYKWQDEVAKYGQNAFPGHRHIRKSENNDELTRLRKENAKLREERDILKKAAAFFAKES